MENENWTHVGNNKKKTQQDKVARPARQKSPVKARPNLVPGMIAYHEEKTKAHNQAKARALEWARRKGQLETKVKELIKSISDADSEIRQHEEFLSSLEMVLAGLAAENAAMEAEATADEETLTKLQTELKTERETGFLLDLEIETANEDMIQARRLLEELVRKAEEAEQSVASEVVKANKLQKAANTEISTLEGNLLEKQTATSVKIERIIDNIALIRGPVQDAFLGDCEAKDLIAKMPAKVRLLAVPLARRVCRACLLNF